MVKFDDEEVNSMARETNVGLPLVFQELCTLGSLSADEIHCTSDGFYAAVKSISEILRNVGILTFPNEHDQERQCDLFFDDWYLYGVKHLEKTVYGLYKMREQEWELDSGILADGDTPGVTISFIAFRTEVLMHCLKEATQTNRKALGKEIDRVVARRGQTHDKVLKQYFVRPEADGPYLVAQLYVSYIASLAKDGRISVPKQYAALYQKSLKQRASHKITRIPRYLEATNEAAGRLICDHSFIFLQDPTNLSNYEKQAILATHTGNVSSHSFAAEVRYHAMFLTKVANVRLPLVGSPYASAIRADMSIGDREFIGPAPYYCLNSKWVKQQEAYHSFE